MTTSASRPASAASTPSSCPGRRWSWCSSALAAASMSSSLGSTSVGPTRAYPRRGMTSVPQADTRKTRLAQQRKTLPDGPGVYLFHDDKGKVIYVGKAKSIKKRIASHFSNPVTRGAHQMVDSIDSVDFILVESETEALLVEQNFIKQYQPRFNIRLRDD